MTLGIKRREGFAGQHLFVLPPSFLSQADRHPLVKDLFLTATGYYPRAPGHLVERPAGVPEVIFIVCISGRGWIQLNQERRLEINADEVAVIPQGVAHSYGADDKAPWSIMWAHFRGIHLVEFVRLLKVTRVDPILKLPSGELERLHFEQLYLILQSGCTLPNLILASARLRLIIIELTRLRVPANHRTCSTYEAIRQNIEWMRLHRHQKLRLAELAAQAGLSVPHYSACLKARWDIHLLIISSD